MIFGDSILTLLFLLLLSFESLKVEEVSTVRSRLESSRLGGISEVDSFNISRAIYKKRSPCRHFTIRDIFKEQKKHGGKEWVNDNFFFFQILKQISYIISLNCANFSIILYYF